jgi:succinate-acetate transporter protein
MTAVDAGAGGTAQPAPAEEAAAEAAPTGLMAGDPLMLGLPVFIAGSFALALTLLGQVQATTFGAPLAVILGATAVGLWISAIWAIALGQSAVAAVLGIFGGFWLSFAVLVLALGHNWFVLLTAGTSTVELFLTTWLIVIVMLTLATLRLPAAYTALFALIGLALLLVLIGTANASSGTLKFAGYVVLLFAALGVYLFFSTVSQATGGKALPLGKPLM